MAAYTVVIDDDISSGEVRLFMISSRHKKTFSNSSQRCCYKTVCSFQSFVIMCCKMVITLSVKLLA
jgi:hypothetical protein